MNFRILMIVAGLATLAGGCAVTPYERDERVYRHDYPVYRETDSYAGYYYIRIIYINGDPWYVDEYRRARPIPRHLHSHFRYSAWVRSLPPRFDRDRDGRREVRDGYELSRIVYIDDVPHYVDDDRRARPVPDRLRSRFAYPVVVPRHDEGRNGGARPQPLPPAYGREQDRQGPPAYGREREREEAQERVREEREGRGTPAGQVPERGAVRDDGRPVPGDKGRNGDEEQRRGRGPTPVGIEQDRGRSQAAPQQEQRAGDGRKTPAGVTQGDELRSGPAADKKNGKAKGPGKDRDKDEREEGDSDDKGDSNAKAP